MQTHTPLLSVFMTTYNHEEYIAEALDSVLMQEVDFDYEIVIGEDCSTDNTRKILLDYQKKYPDKIKLILHEKNVGMQKNSEFVKAKCTGKYMAILDGDDYWIDSNKLQLQVDYMEKNPECSMSFHAAEARIGKSKEGKIVARRAENNKKFTTRNLILGGGDFCPTASIVVRKDIVNNLPNLVNKAPVGDYFLQVIASTYGYVYYFDRVMSVYRQSVDSSWSSLVLKNFEKRRDFYFKFVKFVEELNNYTNYEYDREFRQILSKQHYQMAIVYLYNNDFEKFQKFMQKSYETFPLAGLVYHIDYYLKFFPLALQLLRKIK